MFRLIRPAAVIACITLIAPAVFAQGKPTRQTKPSAAVSPSNASVDLNSATEKELEALPGVGPATAKKIIAGRPYSSTDDLAKAGVSKSTISKIKPLVTVRGAPRPPSASGSSTGRPPAVPPAAAPAMPPSSSRATEPPSAGMVWANLDSKIYHREGDRFYGKTKNGKWMTEADAIAAGYRASKTGPKK
jgi:hypothetical protein